jgi:hypothetical protein
MGSPLNADLLARGQGEPLVAALMAPWARLPVKAVMEAAAPLRWMAALHDLALSGDAPGLAAAYEARDIDRLWAEARPAMADHAARLSAFMGHEPQTNEVRRAICLLPGFLQVARETGLPLRGFELGASAGLNQSWDRFFYEIAGRAWGDPASPVRLDTDWQGAPPDLSVQARVVQRAACDRRPVDIRDPAERRRLLAYLWADQPERLARTRAAIEVALAHDVRVETADAADWLERRVALAPGTATVVYHSSFWQYLPPPTQAAIASTASRLGREATPDAPFAWLRKEPPMDDLVADRLTLTLWPGGQERTLARVHPHGAWVRWSG